MALDAGSVTARIGAIFDPRGFDQYDRRRKKTEAESKRKIEQRLGARTDDRDFNRFERAVRTAAARARNRINARLGARADETGFRRWERRLRDAASKARNRIFARLGARSDESGFNRWERALRRAAVRARNRIVARLKIDADTAGASRFEAALRRVRSSSNSAGGGIRNLRGLILAVGFPIAAAGAAMLAQALSALGAAAVGVAGSLAQAAGAIGAFPNAALGAAQAVGTLVAAFQGVGAAVKSAWDPGASAASSGANKMAQAANKAREATDRMRAAHERVRSAFNAVRDAQEGVADAGRALADAHRNVADAARGVQDAERQVQAAERSLADAQRQARYAQEDLNQARHEAVRELQDMRTAVISARLAEEDATLSIQEAEANLQETRRRGDATQLELARAELSVREARERAREQTIEGSRAEEDYNKARQGGIDQMPGVVAAQRALDDAYRGVEDAARGVQDAHRGVAEAQRQLAEAYRGVEDAQRGVEKAQRALAEAQHDAKLAQQELSEAAQKNADSMDSAAGGADKLGYALNKLSPSARRFALFLISLKPQLDRLREAAASGIFPGLERGIRAALPNLGRLATVLHATGRAFGDTAEQAGKLLGSRGFGRDFQAVGLANARIMRRLGDAAVHITSALRHVAVAAIPFTEWLSVSIQRFARFIDQSAEAGRRTGALARFFDRARDRLTLLWHIARDFGIGFARVLGIADRALGRGLLVSLERLAARFRAFTESSRGIQLITSYFHRMRPAIDQIVGLAWDLVKAIFRLGQSTGFVEMVKVVRSRLLPALERMLETMARISGPAIADALAALAELFQAMAPAIAVVARGVASVVRWLAGVIRHTPGMKTFLTVMLSISAAVAGLKIAGAVLGFSRLGRVLEIVGGATSNATGGMRKFAGAMSIIKFAPVIFGIEETARALGRLPGRVTRVTAAFRRGLIPGLRAIARDAIHELDKIGAWAEHVPFAGPIIRALHAVRGPARRAASGIPRAVEAGIKSGSIRVRRGADFTMNEALEAMKRRREDWNHMGAVLQRGLARGFVDQAGRLRKAASDGVRRAEQQIERRYPNWRREGRNLMGGGASGVRDEHGNMRKAGGEGGDHGQRGLGSTGGRWRRAGSGVGGQGVRGALDQRSAFQRAGSTIGGSGHAGVSSTGRGWFSTGIDLINGLINGVRRQAGRFINAVIHIANDAIHWAKRILHIRSPSAVFTEIGESVGTGLAEGIRNRVSHVAAAAREAAAAAIRETQGLGEAIRDRVAGGSASGGTRGAGAPPGGHRPPPFNFERFVRGFPVTTRGPQGGTVGRAFGFLDTLRRRAITDPDRKLTDAEKFWQRASRRFLGLHHMKRIPHGPLESFLGIGGTDLFKIGQTKAGWAKLTDAQRQQVETMREMLGTRLEQVRGFQETNLQGKYVFSGPGDIGLGDFNALSAVRRLDDSRSRVSAARTPDVYSALARAASGQQAGTGDTVLRIEPLTRPLTDGRTLAVVSGMAAAGMNRQGYKPAKRVKSGL